MTVYVDVADMRLFVAIADTGSQDAAGKKVGMGAGTVSEKIKSLEAAYGVKLVKHERGRPAELTREGKLFVEHARRILRQLEAMNEEMSRFSKGVSGDRAIGSASAPS